MPDQVFGEGTPGVLSRVPDRIDCDIAIVGSGVGGATLAWALRDSGARVLILERGDFLPRERQNWSPREVQQLGRYKNSEPWLDTDGNEFVPGTYEYVGGNSKVYGAAMVRLREADFGAIEHHDGVSPEWPITYADMEPFYGRAETLYWVHGDGGDPTEPWRSTPYPFPPIPHEKAMADVAEGLTRQGLRPFSLPLSVDSRPGGRCVLCGTCDAYPCMVDAKGDADLCAVRPAIQSPTVRLLTGADVRSTAMNPNWTSVVHLAVRRGSQDIEVRASRYVLAAGAVGTGALLLRSRTSSHPEGVANRSGLVGRNYMAHTCSFLIGARPGREHHTVFQKTLGINDWYFAGPGNKYPLGNIQALGKVRGHTMKTARKAIPVGALEWLARRSVDFFIETEDLPSRENRVEVDASGRIHLVWRPTNVTPHKTLVQRMSRALRRCGYPLILTQRLGVAGTAHQCGTARMGVDGATSVVDRNCRSHDVQNLWIVDTSIFPSSAAVNPALTVAANALRVAHLGELTD